MVDDDLVLSKKVWGDWYQREHFEAEMRLFLKYGNDWFFVPAKEAARQIKEEANGKI